MRQITADVVKSPRKRTPARPQAAPRPSSPTEHISGTSGAVTAELSTDRNMPSKSAPTAEPPAEALEPPHSPLASSPAHKHPAQDHVADQADSLPAAPHLDRSAADSATEEAPKPGEPRRESGAGTDRVSSKSISADAELPALTPATTRVKRTLTLTAPSVIKNDTHAPTPAPRSRDASGKRFRSSFLNKSLRRAIEERTTNDSDDDAQDATEDDRRDRTGQTLLSLIHI